MIKSKIILFSLGCVALCLTEACKRPFDGIDNDLNLTPEYAVPLVQTEISIKNFLNGFDNNSALQVQSDGTYLMTYSSSFPTGPSYNLFTNTSATPAIPIAANTMILPFPGPAGTRIDAVEFKKGMFKWDFASPGDPLTITLRLPNLKKNGVTFEKRFMVTPIPLYDSLDLTGWTMTPINGNIAIEYEAKDPRGASINLNGQGTYQFTKFEVRSVQGYVGQADIQTAKDSINIDFFKNTTQGEIKFANPRVVFNFENSFGVPVRARTLQAEVVTLDGRTIALESPLTTGVDIGYPSLSQMGQKRNTSVTLNKDNSNVVTIFNSSPVKLRYAVQGTMNPDANATSSGFLIDTSTLRLRMNVEVPLFGTAKGFTSQDTFAIDLSKFEQLTAAEFRILTENTLPMDMALQGYFLSSEGKVIDSLIADANLPLILRGAPVNNAGRVSAGVREENFITVDANKFTRLRAARKIIVRYYVSTSSQGNIPVHIESNQRVYLNLGVKAKVKL